MSRGIYLCWLQPGHESCTEHNRIEIVNRLMEPLEKLAARMGVDTKLTTVLPLTQETQA